MSAALRIQLMLLARNRFRKQSDLANLTSLHGQHRAQHQADLVDIEQTPVLPRGTKSCEDAEDTGSIHRENVGDRPEASTPCPAEM
jgi:hypothetical protein